MKKNLYQDRFRTPEYFWFSPDTLEFEGFRLIGRSYEAISSNPQGFRWSEELGLYLGIDQGQLRYFTADFQLIPTPAEAALVEMRRTEAEVQRADAETQRADAEAKKAAKLAEKLRELGVDPTQI